MKYVYQKIKSILILITFLFPFQIISQSTVTIGSETYSHYYYGPMYRSSSSSSFYYSHYGYVYTAAELGIPTGSTITSIQFNKSNTGSTSGNNIYKFYMENTSNTTVGAQTWASFITGATEVYNSTTYNFSSSSGWYTINLSTPFTYTGGSLQIGSEWQLTGSSTSSITHYSSAATGKGVGDASNSYAGSDDLQTSYYGNRRPNIKITYSPPCYTSYSGLYYSTPNTTTFESSSDGWQQSTGCDDADWTRQSGGTTSLNTGPTGGSSSTYYMYTETSYPNYPNKNFSIMKGYDFSNSASPKMTFQYHMYGATIGTLNVKANGTTVYTISGQQQTSNGAAWLTSQDIDLSAYAGQPNVVLELSYTGGIDYYGDCAVDNIIVQDDLFTWTGNAGNGNWSTAGNWDANQTPNSSSNCVIPAGVPCDISSGGSCGTLTINSGANAVFLSGTVSVSGDLTDNSGQTIIGGKLDVTGAATFTKALNISQSGELEVDGTLTLASGYTTTNSGTIDANGTFNATGATLAQGSSGNIQLASTVTSLGTLDNAEGKVTYNGTSAQTVLADDYYDLSLELSTKTSGGTINVAGDLDVYNSGIFSIGSTTVTVSGATDIDSGEQLSIFTGTLDANGSFDAAGGTINITHNNGKLRLGGNVTSLGTLSTSTGAVYYDGSSAQTIFADTYNNLWTYSSTKSLGGTVNVNGTFVIASGTVNVGSSTMSVSGLSNIDGTLTLGSGTYNQTGASDIDGYLNIGTGTYNADGDFDASWGDIDFTGTGTLALNTSVTSLGTLDNAQGTVKYSMDGAPTTTELTTTTAGGNGQNGNLFNITNNSSSSITITNLSQYGNSSYNGTRTATVYYNTTPYHLTTSGSAVGWTQVFSGTVSVPNGSYAELDITDVVIPAGATYGFHTYLAATIPYTNGTGTPGVSTLTSNSDITITQGHGTAALYTQSYSPRNWNGKVTYEIAGASSLLSDNYFNLEVNNSSVANGLVNVDGNLTVNSNKSLDMGSNALSLAGNITNNGTLTLTSNTTTFDGSSAQYINSNTTFNNLTINNSAGVELVAPVDVNGVLTLTNGDLKSSSTYKLSIKSGGSVSGGGDDSHITGPMDYVIAGTSEVTMPIGDGNKYRPVYIAPVSGGSTYTAEFKTSNNYGGTTCTNSGSAGVLDHVAGSIHWDISNNGGANATIGLGWDYTINVDVPADMRLSHWDGNAWEAVGQTLTAQNGTGSASPGSGRVSGLVTSFSPFNLGSSGSGNPLPVDLLSFTADCSHDIVDINFSVISQVNNDYFLVEKSKDAVEWEEVGTIEGAGTTNSQMDYSMVDGAADHGLSYYRLTQVDYDGTSKTFDPVSSSCESLGSGLPIEVYPNPMINEVTFELDLDEYQGNEVYYTILDARGSIVLRDNMELSRGFNKQTIDVQNLPNGVYILRFNNTRDHISETRIVKR